MRTKVLVISGSMGAGKTTVLGEASDLLAQAGVVHAAIDLDWLGAGHFSTTDFGDLMFRNLEAVWSNYAVAGVTHLLLARAVADAAEYEQIRRAVGGDEVVVARLTAGLDAMQERIRAREPGISKQFYVQRVAELDALLDQARIEDFAISNQARSVTDVARELLVRAGWLDGTIGDS